jgi:hypothetical protein
MDSEKYPAYFLGTCILYAVVFLVAFSYFIVPAMSYGFVYGDFILLSLLLLLPLPMIAVYSQIPRIQFLWGRERIFRLITLALTMIDFIIVFFFLILLI